MVKARIKLGEVLMDAVVNENPTMSAEVTSHSVEKGEEVADHMKENPFTVILDGSIVDDAPAKIATLRRYLKEKKIVKYVGRNIFTDVVVTKIDSKHNADNAYGFDYNITLKHVRIAKPETFNLNVKNPKSNKKDAKTTSKVKAKTDGGRKQVREK